MPPPAPPSYWMRTRRNFTEYFSEHPTRFVLLSIAALVANGVGTCVRMEWARRHEPMDGPGCHYVEEAQAPDPSKPGWNVVQFVVKVDGRVIERAPSGDAALIFIDQHDLLTCGSGP